MPRSALLVLLLALAGACTPAATCDATSCQGCCDSAGFCRFDEAQACGSAGSACTACSPGATCQGGVCVPGSSCLPTSCLAQQKNCGTLSDGCGGTLTCGTCEVQGESCGGAAGTPNVCGPGVCVAKTCASLGATCGMVSDGCGGLLNCGTCTAAGETCGGGGTANVCGMGACVPKTCGQLAKNCGTVSDGCTGQLSCGVCTAAGESCGGGGVPNVCGPGACTPTTCSALGKNCGMVADGCGNMIPCGTCTGFQTCGGGGTANVCGATCIVSCPTGFTCNGGVCSGGNLASLVLDVPVPPLHAVSGRLTRNGATPMLQTACSYVDQNIVSLSFEHATDSRFNTGASVRCESATASSMFRFAVDLYPGTYKVTVQRPDSYDVPSNLPRWSTVVNPAFVVSGPQSNVTLDVPVPPLHAVSGRLTRNGATPMLETACSYVDQNIVSLSFEHATDARFNTGASVRCESATASSMFRFAVDLYPGTYKVTVQRPDSYDVPSNLPRWATVVNPAFVVSGPQSNVTLDVPVPPLHAVSGRLTRNGATPMLQTACSYVDQNIVSLSFEHATDARFNTGASVRCESATASSMFRFAVDLYPGTYKVTVQRPDSYDVPSNLPRWDTVVVERLQVP